jgi:hypothetical protein
MHSSKQFHFTGTQSESTEEFYRQILLESKQNNCPRVKAAKTING